MVSFLKQMSENEFLRGLFDKKIVAVIELFIKNKNNEFYLREISQKTNVSPASTFRIINKLVKQDIIQIRKINKFKFYKLSQNKKTSVLEELFKINPLEKFLELIKRKFGIQSIILYGKKADNKADLLLIGNIEDKKEINKITEAIKQDFSFEINFLTFSVEQFNKMTEMGLYPREKKLLWKSI